MPPDLDPRLWVVRNQCGTHRDYLFGNPHTFPGRMAVYCPDVLGEMYISKQEVVDAAQASKDWMAGYLAGNEPSPPFDEDYPSENAWAEAIQVWSSRTERFRREGEWPVWEKDLFEN